MIATRLTDAALEISWHLEGVRKLFKPDVRITILVRDPSRLSGSGDLVLTDDELLDAIGALAIARHKETKKGATVIGFPRDGGAKNSSVRCAPEPPVTENSRDCNHPDADQTEF